MTDHPELRTATSLVDYIFRFLEYKFVDGGGFSHAQLTLFKGSVEVLDVVPSQTGMGCPECGSLLHFAEGCMICRTCGYSKCG
jgi:ribonucleoside-diphosphate reductase alpha chain